MNFTLRNTEFAREFADLANFIGGAELQEAIVRVGVKLQPLPQSLRILYLDRYFFHDYCATIADGPVAFQLDVSDKNAIRVASLIAGINRLRMRLSASAAAKFRRTIIGALRPDRDIRPLEHEVRTFVHLGQKKVATTLVDLENLGRFDIAFDANGNSFEVECKTVTEDTGEQIKTDLLVTLCEVFRRTFKDGGGTSDTGLFVLAFNKQPSMCRNLHSALRDGLRSSSLPLRSNDLELAFEPKPDWGPTTPDVIRRDLEAVSRKHYAARFGNNVLALALQPHKPSSLAGKIVDTLKEAADQCSGQRPSLLWLHLIGHSEDEFLRLATFSQKGDGAGLNALVAKVLHPRASSTDRTHVHTIRFSAEAAGTTQRPILDEGLMIRTAKSLSGPCYDVPNPFCRFKINLDV